MASREQSDIHIPFFKPGRPLNQLTVSSSTWDEHGSCSPSENSLAFVSSSHQGLVVAQKFWVGLGHRTLSPERRDITQLTEMNTTRDAATALSDIGFRVG